MIVSTLLKYLTGGIVDKVVDLVKSYQGTQLSEKELRANVETEMIQTLSGIVKSQESVIIAEMKSDSWVARSWRPLTAISLSTCIIFVTFIMPMLVSWFSVPDIKADPMLLKAVIDAWLVMVGGYVGLRSLEKVVKVIWKH